MAAALLRPACCFPGAESSLHPTTIPFMSTRHSLAFFFVPFLDIRAVPGLSQQLRTCWLADLRIGQSVFGIFRLAVALMYLVGTQVLCGVWLSSNLNGWMSKTSMETFARKGGRSA